VYHLKGHKDEMGELTEKRKWLGGPVASRREVGGQGNALAVELPKYANGGLISHYCELTS
jgi:hypothetical protein